MRFGLFARAIAETGGAGEDDGTAQEAAEDDAMNAKASKTGTDTAEKEEEITFDPPAVKPLPLLALLFQLLQLLLLLALLSLTTEPAIGPLALDVVVVAVEFVALPVAFAAAM